MLPEEKRSMADLNCTELTDTDTWKEEYRYSCFDCSLSHFMSHTDKSPLTVLTQPTSSLAEVSGCKRDTKMSTVRRVSTLLTWVLVFDDPTMTGFCLRLGWLVPAIDCTRADSMSKSLCSRQTSYLRFTCAYIRQCSRITIHHTGIALTH